MAGVVDVVLGPTPLVALLPVAMREPKRLANAHLARRYALAANRG
ncbi:hypothetical protein ACFQ1S_19320 [Kibdelosporangium lantanae]|uniref:Uncharacterized protein n=1 Tax=Kibdelosporangium lantanae TaxID=1497396 RepID=A0ABW3M9X3_9PSEU